VRPVAGRTGALARRPANVLRASDQLTAAADDLFRPASSSPVPSSNRTNGDGSKELFSGIRNHIPRTVILDPPAPCTRPDGCGCLPGFARWWLKFVPLRRWPILLREPPRLPTRMALARPASLPRGSAPRQVRPSDLEARLDCRWFVACRWCRFAGGVPMCAQPRYRLRARRPLRHPHGHPSCIMLPALMRLNKPVTPRAPCCWSRPLWGTPARTPVMSLMRSSPALGMPRSLGSVQIGPESFRAPLRRGDADTVGAARNPLRIAGPAAAEIHPPRLPLTCPAVNRRSCCDSPSSWLSAAHRRISCLQIALGAETASLRLLADLRAAMTPRYSTFDPTRPSIGDMATERG